MVNLSFGDPKIIPSSSPYWSRFDLRCSRSWWKWKSVTLNWTSPSEKERTEIFKTMAFDKNMIWKEVQTWTEDEDIWTVEGWRVIGGNEEGEVIVEFHPKTGKIQWNSEHAKRDWGVLHKVREFLREAAATGHELIFWELGAPNSPFYRRINSGLVDRTGEVKLYFEPEPVRLLSSDYQLRILVLESMLLPHNWQDFNFDEPIVFYS